MSHGWNISPVFAEKNSEFLKPLEPKNTKIAQNELNLICLKIGKSSELLHHR